ncbi:hypothetical protein PInf_008501 [Phytophthora infestans]|nr:hypothetical protein PInf_008501 [Phytophthora infestans]
MAPTTSSEPSLPPSTSSAEFENRPAATSKNETPTTSSNVGEEGDSLQTQISVTDSSSSTPTSATIETGQQEQRPTAQTSSNTSSREHATFGTIRSKTGGCIVGDPDTYISPKDLQWVWDNRIKDEVMVYNNWILDHLVANKGTINYCIRWDSSSTKLTKEIAKKLQPVLTRQHAAWNRWLIGYNCWPYDEIKVNIVVFAAKEASELGWSDNSMGKLYIGDLAKDGSPQCPDKCYRSLDGSPGGWSTSSGCEGKPFDISLWPTQGLGGGWGTYWGQQVDLDDMLEHLDDDFERDVHGGGGGDGARTENIGGDVDTRGRQPMEERRNSVPTTLSSISMMGAFTSASVKDTDDWMLRRVLENKKYNF